MTESDILPGHDPIKTLEALVAHATVSSNQQGASESNAKIMDHIQRTLESYGGVVTRSSIDPASGHEYIIPDGKPEFVQEMEEDLRKFNRQDTMVVRFGPEKDSGGVLFSAHTDVQPVNLDLWNTDPFVLTKGEKGTADEGKLIGRGTADMLGFLSNMIRVGAMLDGKAEELAEPVYLAFSWGEEIGCAGSKYMQNHLEAHDIYPSVYLIGEGTENDLVVSHKGGMFMEAVVEGRPTAGQEGMVPHDALRYAHEMQDKIYTLQDKIMDDGSNAAYPHLNNPRFSPAYPVVNSGKIEGGAIDSEAKGARYVIDVSGVQLHSSDPEKGLDANRYAHEIRDYIYKELQDNQKIPVHIERIEGGNGGNTIPGESKIFLRVEEQEGLDINEQVLQPLRQKAADVKSEMEALVKVRQEKEKDTISQSDLPVEQQEVMKENADKRWRDNPPEIAITALSTEAVAELSDNKAQQDKVRIEMHARPTPEMNEQEVNSVLLSPIEKEAGSLTEAMQQAGCVADGGSPGISFAQISKTLPLPEPKSPEVLDRIMQTYAEINKVPLEAVEPKYVPYATEAGFFDAHAEKKPHVDHATIVWSTNGLTKYGAHGPHEFNYESDQLNGVRFLAGLVNDFCAVERGIEQDGKPGDMVLPLSQPQPLIEIPPVFVGRH